MFYVDVLIRMYLVCTKMFIGLDVITSETLRPWKWFHTRLPP